MGWHYLATGWHYGKKYIGSQKCMSSKLTAKYLKLNKFPHNTMQVWSDHESRSAALWLAHNFRYARWLLSSPWLVALWLAQNFNAS